MKIYSSRPKKNGNRVMFVELKPGEQLVSIREDQHYRLGYPVEDVVGSHIIAEAVPVVWCSASQKWVDAC